MGVFQNSIPGFGFCSIAGFLGKLLNLKLMKSRLLLIVLLISFIQYLNAQNYYDWVTEALELYQKGDYSLSAQKWDQAFKKRKGFSTDYYNAACIKALEGKKKEALQYLRYAIEQGYEDISWLEKDADFSSLWETKEWENFLKEIPNIQAKRMKGLKLKQKELLEELRMQDQVIRLLLPDAEKRFGRKSNEYKWFSSKLMARNDSIVLEEIKLIINEHGWLGISEVGELANQTLWLVIQHAPVDVQEKYLPLLEESVEKGESKGWYYAFLIDRVLMRKGEKQIYGTQALWNKDLEKNVIYPIQNPKEVDKLRKSVGLEPLEQYVAKNGYLYNQTNR